MAKPSLRQFNFIFDPKVQSMDEIQQRRLLLVMVIDSRGDLDRLDEGELACALRLSPEELVQSKALFLKKGLIDESWHIRLTSTAKAVKKTTASSTERVRRHRSRKQEIISNETLRETPDVTLNGETVVCSSSVFTDKEKHTTTTQQTTPSPELAEKAPKAEAPVVIFHGVRVPIRDLGLTDEDVGKIVEWEIQQRHAKKVLRNAGALRRHLVDTFDKGVLDVTDYLSAFGRLPVPPQPFEEESKCTRCVYCEGNLCSVDYESKRVMKPMQADSCERFALKEEGPPMDPEDVNKLITGIFVNEPVPQFRGPVQRRMKDNVSFDLRKDLDRKRLERALGGVGEINVEGQEFIAS